MTHQTQAPDPSTPERVLLHRGTAQPEAWWRHAVIYQIYPRSFADANGDGMGDLPGITARLPYLRDLGVDAVWLSPFYTSPQADAGYDVADYRDVDPRFGSLDDARRLIARAGELDLRIIVDLVPNHSSDEHAWFRAALAAGPGSPERDRYLFRTGRGPHGEEPPNNWESQFGGPAWTRVSGPDGPSDQWYLHLFDTKQPDFNWEHPDVRAEFESVLRFWLDLGVDGFRVDVAHGLVKEADLPDWHRESTTEHSNMSAQGPMWDQDGVHEVYESWRRVLDSYNTSGDPDQDRIMCAEAWVAPVERAARYVRPAEFHQAFNFDFLETAWDASALRRVIAESYAANDSVGATTTWVLSNHDVVRHATRLGYRVDEPRSNGIGPDDPQPDAALGLRRARAATALMLALPGGAYLYQGEELGLPEHTTMAHEFRQDPTYRRTGGAEVGRDGCRVPLPWEGRRPGLGFGPSPQTWLPQPDAYADLAVDQQEGDEGSTLELYRRMLRLRRELALAQGSLTLRPDTGAVVSLRNRTAQSGIDVISNLGAAPVRLPEQAEVLLASAPIGADRLLLPDTTVWLR